MSMAKVTAPPNAYIWEVKQKEYCVSGYTCVASCIGHGAGELGLGLGWQLQGRGEPNHF